MTDTAPPQGFKLSPRDNTLEERLAGVPVQPGVYLFRDEKGRVIYVGKAVNLRSRVRQYFHGGDERPKTESLVQQVRGVEWMVTGSEVEALILELNLIKRHRPAYNVRMRDDKHYPYLCLTFSEEYPRIIVTRRINPRDGNAYFGPYASSKAMHSTVKLLKQVFKIRSCGASFKVGPEQRPCLFYHIGQCDAPCAMYVTEEQYREGCRQARQFLEGRHTELLKQFERRMQAEAEALRFEAAARTRDKIQAIEGVLATQRVAFPQRRDEDVVALAQKGAAACAEVLTIREGRMIGQDSFMIEGTLDEDPAFTLSQFVQQYYADAVHVPRTVRLQYEIADWALVRDWLGGRRGGPVALQVPQRGAKRRIVEMAAQNAQLALDQFLASALIDRDRALEAMRALSEALDLDSPPRRIECFDVSNIQGKHAVASMVVFEEGRPKKSDYRHFKIRMVEETPNDYAMMREALTRRLLRLKEPKSRFGERPSLIVVDGGREQVSAAEEAMIATGERVQVVGLAKEHEEIIRHKVPGALRLDRGHRALLLLQQIRDEAHRFALAYHTLLRHRRGVRSILDDVPGIGLKRRKALLRHFGSLKRIREATVEELAAVKGMSRPAAESLRGYFAGEVQPERRLPGLDA
jgi:excinuclease ABC subunit C